MGALLALGALLVVVAVGRRVVLGVLLVPCLLLALGRLMVLPPGLLLAPSPYRLLWMR